MHDVTPQALARYPVDLDILREELGGDGDLVRNLCRLFGADTPRLMQDIERALATGDLQLVHRTAHRLKGSIGVFHAPQVYEVAQQLEAAADRHDSAPAQSAFDELQCAVGTMLARLNAEGDRAGPA